MLGGIPSFLSHNSAYGEQLEDQDVDISSGSTVSHSGGLTIKQLTGGPYTINNRGTIEATNVTSNSDAIRLEVGSSVTNSGLIDSSGSANLSSIYFTNNLESNSLSNSGTIQTETTGNYGQGVHIEDANLAEITNASGGTIKVTDSALNSGAIRVDSGAAVNTITNEGTISATGSVHTRGIISINSATINEIINKGTISAQGGSNTNRAIVFWNNSGTSVTNYGTIQATGTSGHGIRLGSSGSISSITNSGTITGSLHGIANSGSVTNIVNTGTITGTSGYGIWTTGSITNFTNSQSNLTYKNNLPTNYSVVINSLTDFGKVTFTTPSGTLNFGISSLSDLCEVCEETTYSSVLSGLSSSDIASGTSGSFTSGARTHDWTLENSSGNLWDLVIASIADDTNTSVENLKPNVLFGINNLNSVTDANTNYDCDLFGEDNLCFSLGGRHVSNPTTPVSVNGLVFVGGIKVSEKFRWGGFLQSNVSHKTPSNFSLSDKTPLLGTFLVWNEKENKLGYQFKLGNAFQQKNASITRPVVGTSVEGLGKTVIGAESYLAELQYAHRFSDTTILKPYFAARHALITQDAYTETGKCALTFNKIKDKSNTILSGLKFESALTSKFSLNGNFGVEHDVNHSINKIKPTGISDLTTVSLDNSFKRTRAVVSAGFDYYFSPAQRLSAVFQHQELAYESKTESNAYINYTIGF